MPMTYNELNDLCERQKRKIKEQDTIISSLVESLDSKQNKITTTNKLESDLVDDTGQTNKFVTEENKTSWNGKSVVVANPQLAGTEPALEGLEVDGVKYKAGEGELYCHKIYITPSNGFANSHFSFSVGLFIYTPDSTAYTKSNIAEKLIQYTGTQYLNVTQDNKSSAKGYEYNVDSYFDEDGVLVIEYKDTSAILQTYNDSAATLSDRVTRIL